MGYHYIITTYPHFLFVFLCSTIAALPFAHTYIHTHIMETSLATELSWDLGSASLESVDIVFEEFGLRACTAWS